MAEEKKTAGLKNKDQESGQLNKPAKQDKTDKPEQAPKKSWFGKVVGWFKRLPRNIARPFKNMAYELKKVTWPSRRKLVSYSIIVLVFMLFMGVVIGLLDMGASSLVKLLIV